MKLGIERISLLPYHEWGAHKYVKLGRKYSFDSYAVSSSQLCKIKQIFESKGLSVTVKK